LRRICGASPYYKIIKLINIIKSNPDKYKVNESNDFSCVRFKRIFIVLLNIPFLLLKNKFTNHKINENLQMQKKKCLTFVRLLALRHIIISRIDSSSIGGLVA